MLRNLKDTWKRTVAFTIGHILIATTIVFYVTDTTLYRALLASIMEPIVIAAYYFVFDTIWNLKKPQDNKLSQSV